MPSRNMSLTGACGRLIGSWREVRAAQPGELGVQVGEQASLQQWVVGGVDAGDDVPEVEGHLLGLGEEVDRVGVEGQQPHRLHRHQLLRHHLGRVEQVDPLEHLVGAVRHDLDAELPLREGAGLDRVGEVAAVEVGVGPGDDLRLLPDQGVHAELRLPVELHQRGVTVGVRQPEGVDPEALHRPEGPRDAPVGHVPEARGAWPRCAARRSPRRCHGRSGPAGSRGPGAAWPRGSRRGT